MESGSADVLRLFAPDLLVGQIAVVTGGGSGIGYAIARDLAACGADLAIASRDASRLEEAAEKITAQTGRPCLPVKCNVREESNVRHLVATVQESLGPATIVVNNAAATFPVKAENLTRRALGAAIETDVFGTFQITQGFLPDMLENRRGSVLNIAMAHPELGFPGFTHAGAAKAAVVSMTASWAREWGRYGIRVNAIGPGMTPTDGVAVNMLSLQQDASSEAFAAARSAIAMQRLGRVTDISAAAVFLCSPAASWITGVNLPVDGGYRLNRAITDG